MPRAKDSEQAKVHADKAIELAPAKCKKAMKDFRASLAELAEVAGVELSVSDERRARTRNGHRPRGKVGTRETVPAAAKSDGDGAPAPTPDT